MLELELSAAVPEVGEKMEADYDQMFLQAPDQTAVEEIREMVRAQKMYEDAAWQMERDTAQLRAMEQSNFYYRTLYIVLSTDQADAAGNEE